MSFNIIHPSLKTATRTSGIVLTIFTLSYFVMGLIYGRLEIGEKKSKPLFYSMTLTIFITDFVTFVMLIIMTIHDQTPFWNDLIALILAFVIQLIAVKIFVSIGNALYFINFTPENVLIINNNSNDFYKIYNYLNRHKKQFKIANVIDNYRLSEKISLDKIDKLILLDLTITDVEKALKYTYLTETDVLYNYKLYDVFKKGQSSIVIDDVLLYVLEQNKITLLQSLLKRLLDIIISLFALIIFSPIMIVISILIKLNDGGPIIYKQIRMTKNCRPFKIYKFRSMKMNSGEQPVLENDDRITKIGHIIRKLRVDELPQLINILIGDMSIVGPRPESKTIMDEILVYLPEFKYRLKVKAGLTGYAQIFGKYNTSPKSKLYFDLYYIENFSIPNDFKLIFQTLIVFFKKDSTEGHRTMLDIKEDV